MPLITSSTNPEPRTGEFPSDVSDAGLPKVVRSGTHRVCPPDVTLRRIEPLLPRMGISRLADITWLDDIGIPVYQAVRPNAYTLSVSQGKGLTGPLAKVSAAMESIETWHAEQVPGGERIPAREVVPTLGYRLEELPLLPRHHLSGAAELEWTQAVHLVNRSETLVPTECVRLDGRTSGRWHLQLFHTTSNGLASGNTMDEAVLHGLYEVVERDAIARAASLSGRTLVDPDTVAGAAGTLIAQFRAARVSLRIDVMPSPVGVACLRVRIVSDAFPVVFEGMGCHLDRDVALCRALTEAAQSRVTAISGARDDVSGDCYRRAAEVVSGTAGVPALDQLYPGAPTVAFESVGSVQNRTLAEDLELVATRVIRWTGREPLVVDHTRPEFGIPVARVVCPGLRYDPSEG